MLGSGHGTQRQYDQAYVQLCTQRPIAFLCRQYKSLSKPVQAKEQAFHRRHQERRHLRHRGCRHHHQTQLALVGLQRPGLSNVRVVRFVDPSNNFECTMGALKLHLRTRSPFLASSSNILNVSGWTEGRLEDGGPPGARYRPIGSAALHFLRAMASRASLQGFLHRELLPQPATSGLIWLIHLVTMLEIA